MEIHSAYNSRVYFHSFTFVTHISPLLPPQQGKVGILIIWPYTWQKPTLKCCTLSMYPNIQICIDILRLKHNCFSSYFQGMIETCVFRSTWKARAVSCCIYITSLVKGHLSARKDTFMPGAWDESYIRNISANKVNVYDPTGNYQHTIKLPWAN